MCISFNTNLKCHRYLKSVIGPASKLHDTSLFVKGEILDVHFTGGMINGRRFPLNLPSGHQGCLRGQGHLEIAISTAKINIKLSKFAKK